MAQFLTPPKKNMTVGEKRFANLLKAYLVHLEKPIRPLKIIDYFLFLMAYFDQKCYNNFMFSGRNGVILC